MNLLRIGSTLTVHQLRGTSSIGRDGIRRLVYGPTTIPYHSLRTLAYIPLGPASLVRFKQAISSATSVSRRYK